jgi:phosphatidylglycerol---prolipoprotein diacylglyceryl transferase
MLPTLLRIGPVTLHSYGLMIALGFLAALYGVQRDAQKRGIDPQAIQTMAFWALLAGIAGTRLLHIIMFPGGYSWTDPIGWIAIWRGGLVFQGALPLSIAYVYFGCRHYKVPFWVAVDCAIPYLPLAHAFGRVGCFMNGCCYGARTSLPWGIRFPRVPWNFAEPATGSPVYIDHCQRFSGLSMTHDHWSYPVHPTQIYGIIGLLALCGILLYWRNKRPLFDGFTMPLYFMLYAVGRFFVEFLRGDHNPTVFGAISQQQLFCFVYLAIGVALFLILRQYAARNAARK